MQQKTKYTWLKRILAITWINLFFAFVTVFVEVYRTKNEESVRYIIWTLALGLALYLVGDWTIRAWRKEATL